jgi:hypothetical protein
MLVRGVRCRQRDHRLNTAFSRCAGRTTRAETKMQPEIWLTMKTNNTHLYRCICTRSRCVFLLVADVITLSNRSTAFVCAPRCSASAPWGDQQANYFSRTGFQRTVLYFNHKTWFNERTIRSMHCQTTDRSAAKPTSPNQAKTKIPQMLKLHHADMGTTEGGAPSDDVKALAKISAL